VDKSPACAVAARVSGILGNDTTNVVKVRV